MITRMWRKSHVLESVVGSKEIAWRGTKTIEENLQTKCKIKGKCSWFIVYRGNIKNLVSTKII